MLAEGNAQKVASKICQTQKMQSSHSVNRLAQTRKNTRPPTRLVIE